MRLFYHFLNTDKPAEKKLLNDSDYCDFSKQVREKYFRSDFFRAFCARPEDFGIASGFISDVAFGVYRRWRKKPADDRPDLDTLADMTAKMLMGGLKGLG